MSRRTCSRAIRAVKRAATTGSTPARRSFKARRARSRFLPTAPRFTRHPDLARGPGCSPRCRDSSSRDATNSSSSNARVRACAIWLSGVRRGAKRSALSAETSGRRPRSRRGRRSSAHRPGRKRRLLHANPIRCRRVHARRERRTCPVVRPPQRPPEDCSYRRSLDPPSHRRLLPRRNRPYRVRHPRLPTASASTIPRRLPAARRIPASSCSPSSHTLLKRMPRAGSSCLTGQSPPRPNDSRLRGPLPVNRASAPRPSAHRVPRRARSQARSSRAPHRTALPAQSDPAGLRQVRGAAAAIPGIERATRSYTARAQSPERAASIRSR